MDSQMPPEEELVYYWGTADNAMAFRDSSLYSYSVNHRQMGDKSCRVKSVIQTEQHRASSGQLRLSWWPQFITDLCESFTKAIFPGCNLNMWTSSGDEVYLRHIDDN